MDRIFVLANDSAVTRWVEERTGVTFLPPYTNFGFLKGDRLVGGIVFHMWTSCDVQIGAALEPGGINRRIIQGIARYVFLGEGCRRVTITTPASNLKAQEAAKRLGFKFECRKADFFPSEDGMAFRLLKSECRWLTDASRT